MNQVKVTVISQQGHCAYHHKVGDAWVCGGTTPGGLCASAYSTIYPTLRALGAGGKFDWANADGSLDMCCSDHKNPVIMRLQVIE